DRTAAHTPEGDVGGGGWRRGGSGASRVYALPLPVVARAPPPDSSGSAEESGIGTNMGGSSAGGRAVGPDTQSGEWEAEVSRARMIALRRSLDSPSRCHSSPHARAVVWTRRQCSTRTAS